MKSVVISGTGLWTPELVVTNDELVTAFNAYVDLFNAEHASDIEAGEMEALDYSSSAFIEKASGIKQRYVVNKSGILDPKRLRPLIPQRPDEQLSLQAEVAVKAARQALATAELTADDIDGIIVACTSSERPYPAIAIEVQKELGMTRGFGFDMNVACSSATFGLQTAVDAIRSGSARRMLVISPEICSPQLAFQDRDCHFIFGDVATAMVLEEADNANSKQQWEILGTHLITQFSNNIRGNMGYLNRCAAEPLPDRELLFRQQGRRIFKEVCPMVVEHINGHLGEHELDASQLKRMWLHQANLNMNQFIAKRLLGHPASREEAPVVLDEYANTAAAGSIIAFHKHQDGFESGELGVICSFGAGYSIGSVIVKRR